MSHQALIIEFFNYYFFFYRSDIDPDNPHHDQYVSNIVNSLIQELENKAATLTSEDMFLTKLKLMEAASTFRVKKFGNIYDFFFLN